MLIKSVLRLAVKSQCKVFYSPNSAVMINFTHSYRFGSFMKKDNPFTNQDEEKVKMLKEEQKKQLRDSQKQLPIIKTISDAKSPQEIDAIFDELNYLKEKDQEIAIRYTLTAIYKKNLPQQLLEQSRLLSKVKKFSELYMEMQLYRVNLLLSKIQSIQSAEHPSSQKIGEVASTYNQINDIFYEAFNKTLKDIEPKNHNKYKSTLYKQFSNYNFQYLYEQAIQSTTGQLSEEQKHNSHKILTKSLQFLKESMIAHKAVILSEKERKQNDKDLKKLQQYDPDRYVIVNNAIKENIRKLVESLGECLYAFFKVISKENQLIKDPESSRLRRFQLLGLLDIYIPLFSIVPGIKAISMTYFKLYKIKIESKHIALNPKPKTPQESKNKMLTLIQEYGLLFKECEDSMEAVEETDNFQLYKELIATMLGVKFMMGRSVKKSNDDIRKALAQGALDVIEKTKSQWKAPTKEFLTKIIKEMMRAG